METNKLVNITICGIPIKSRYKTKNSDPTDIYTLKIRGVELTVMYNVLNLECNNLDKLFRLLDYSEISFIDSLGNTTTYNLGAYVRLIISTNEAKNAYGVNVNIEKNINIAFDSKGNHQLNIFYIQGSKFIFDLKNLKETLG